MYRTVPAQYSHIPLLVADVRPEDKLEAEALGLNVAQGLARALSVSRDANTVFFNDTILAMYGIAVPSGLSELSDVGEPWMAGTKTILKHKKQLLRESDAFVQAMSKKYSWLVNVVDARYDSAIRWLCWLGFDINPEEKPWGPDNLPFYMFEMKAA